MDNFFKGKLALRPAEKLRNIGLIIDRAENYDNIRRYVFQTADMCCLAGGININSYAITDEPVGSRSFQNHSGAFSGEIGNPGTLIRAMNCLLENRCHEIDAFAVATQIQIPSDALEKYHHGLLPDPHGGIEAITSHLLSWRSGKMVAHGPLLSEKEIFTLLNMNTVDTRATGEIIGGIGFLGCVFIGLSRSPELHFLRPGVKEYLAPEWLSPGDIAAIVAPWNALGGYPMLSAAANDIPIIAVRENNTILNVTKDTMGYGNHVIEVANYMEAAALTKRIIAGNNYIPTKEERKNLESEGFAIAEKAGISPASLHRPVESVEHYGKIF